MYFNSYVLKIIFAKKQSLIYIIIFSSVLIIICFFLFFKTFTKYYIDELKLLYPTLYLVKDKPIQNYKIDGMDVEAQIFEINIDGFKISFNKEENFTLGSLGIRSFSKNHIPKCLSKSYESGATIYVSSKIYKDLVSIENFNEYLYISSDINGKFYKLKVKEFILHEHSKWILLENETGRKLYRDSFFNKLVFYTNEDDSSAQKKLQKNFSNIIYRWDEYISLTNRALKESMLYIFSFMSMAILILSIASIIFFARELIDDLYRLTNYSIFYGVSFVYLYISYLFIASSIVISIVSVAYLCAYSLNNILVAHLWSVSSYNDISFLIAIVMSTILILGVALYIGLHNLYNAFSKGIAHV